MRGTEDLSAECIRTGEKTNCQKAGAGCNSRILEREKLCSAGSRSTESAASCNAISLYGIDPVLRQMVQEYQIYVFSLEELREEYFRTNLRELIGLMKRRASKTEIQKYCREHADRISRMDVATYDMICKMLNLKELQDKKEKYLDNGKESVDMCKAMEEWAEELREEGKSVGMKEGIQQERKNTLQLVAKMSENGDTEYIARLLEPEVYQRMMDKYGME